MERITLIEAAALLKVHRNTVLNYIKKKFLTAYRLIPGGNITLSKEQVEKLCKAVE